MEKFKLALKCIALFICMVPGFSLFADETESPYRISGNYSYSSSDQAKYFGYDMKEKEPGVYEYTFTNIEDEGSLYFRINNGDVYYGSRSEALLESGKSMDVVIGNNSNVPPRLYFAIETDMQYTVTFNINGDKPVVSLEVEEQPEVPALPTKYLLAGSFMGSSDNVSFELTPVEGSENLYSYTFENTVGILFFMIDAVINGSDNIYYGAADAVNTPLVGSYNTVSDTDGKKVGSLFFEMKEGKKYTVTFDASTNTVVLITSDATDSPLTITSFYDNTSSEATIFPEFRIEYTDIATEDYRNNKVSKFEITTWDAELTKRKNIVYSFTASDDESAPTLSDFIENLKTVFEFNAETGRYKDKEVFNNKGEYIYTDGDYIYRLTLTVTEGTSTRRHTVYSDEFTVNTDGNPLVISAFYLVQLGNGESNYLTMIDEDHSYPYSVTDAYGQLGQSNQITFGKADFEDGDTIDFGDETIYKFTDKVLIRSNIPFNKDEQWRIDHCELYVREEDGKEIPVVNSFNNRNVMTDGRFMAIVNLYELLDNAEYPKENKEDALTKPLDELTYILRIWYNNASSSGGEDPDSSNIPSDGLPYYEASVPLTVTVPMPRVENNYIEAFYGTLSKDSDISTETSSFPSSFEYVSSWQNEDGSYNSYQLNGARFHNLRKVLVIKSPNVTLNLGKIMQDKSTGVFKYSYKYYNEDGELVYEDPFEIAAATDDDKLWTLRSKCVLPETLLELENDGLYAKEQVACESTFKKSYPRWTDTDIVRINMEDESPVGDSFKFKVLDGWNGRENTNKEFVETFTVRLFLWGIHSNQIFYPSEICENDRRELMYNQRGNARDYFLVEFVDTSDGEVLAVWNNTVENPENAEQVVSATDMYNGKEVRFVHNHHKTAEEVDKDYFYKNLEVRVSYLYPFNEGDIRRPNASSSVIAHKAGSSRFTGEVIKSQPSHILLTMDDDIFTSVENFEAGNEIMITYGKSYIDISGGYAEVYNLNGIKVAEGEGRHEVAPGIYVVNAGSRMHKIIIK